VNGVDLDLQLFQGMIHDTVKYCDMHKEPLQLQYSNGKHGVRLIKLPMSKGNDGRVVGTLPQGYIRNVPLPRVPREQSAKSRLQVTTIPDYYEAPYVVPMYISPRSIVESAAYAFSPAWHAIAINT
jgi:hypothetical protein